MGSSNNTIRLLLLEAGLTLFISAQFPEVGCSSIGFSDTEGKFKRIKEAVGISSSHMEEISKEIEEAITDMEGDSFGSEFDIGEDEENEEDGDGAKCDSLCNYGYTCTLKGKGEFYVQALPEPNCVTVCGTGLSCTVQPSRGGVAQTQQIQCPQNQRPDRNGNCRNVKLKKSN